VTSFPTPLIVLHPAQATVRTKQIHANNIFFIRISFHLIKRISKQPSVPFFPTINGLKKSREFSRRDYDFRDLFVGHILKDHGHSAAAVIIGEMLNIQAVMRPGKVPLDQIVHFRHNILSLPEVTLPIGKMLLLFYSNFSHFLIFSLE
jgi:hypothetical protein